MSKILEYNENYENKSILPHISDDVVMTQFVMSQKINLNKKTIAKIISCKYKFKMNDVEKCIDCLIDTIIENLSINNAVNIMNFGIFSCKMRKKKLGRNPKNPEEIFVIPERFIVTFKPDKRFKHELNENI